MQTRPHSAYIPTLRLMGKALRSNAPVPKSGRSLNECTQRARATINYF